MRQLLQDIRDLLALAWPVVISRTGILTLSITDTVMVGIMHPSILPMSALAWCRAIFSFLS